MSGGGPSAARSTPLHPRQGWRHWGAFALAGTLAFVTDAGVLQLMLILTPLGPFGARPFAIMAAIAVSWIVNRTITFRTAAPPSLMEFGRFAAVAWGGSILNYAIYSAVLLLRPATAPFLALVIASAICMVYSYVGMRFAVFGQDAQARARAPVE